MANLIWEVKTASGVQDSSHTYAWGNDAGIASCGASVSLCNTDAFVAALNAVDLCGETANDWRLPTVRELLGIVHNGLPNFSTAMIDVNYFPATQSNWYWTSDTFAPDPSFAWIVLFYDGDSGANYKTDSGYVRLVRSGQ